MKIDLIERHWEDLLRLAVSVGGAAIGEGGNILIIDDEIKLLKLLGMILSQENFNVKEASTARSAMTMLEQYEFDVVLSDVRLPDAFGVELVKAIKTKYPDRKSVV